MENNVTTGEQVLSSWKLKLIGQKFYFDSGNAIMSYPTKVMLVFGMGSVFTGVLRSPGLIALAGIGYGVLLYLCGRVFVDGGFRLCEQEMSNIHDQFVREIRKQKTI